MTTLFNANTVSNAEADFRHIAEIATGRSGGLAGGAPISTSTDRLGAVKKTVEAVIDGIAATSPKGDWAASTNYSVKDVVKESATWWICVEAHTSSATFTSNGAYWRVYQGVAKDELADATNPLKGAGLVGAAEAIPGELVAPDFSAAQPAQDTNSRFALLASLIKALGDRSPYAIEVWVSDPRFGGLKGYPNDDTSVFQSAFNYAKSLTTSGIGPIYSTATVRVPDGLFHVAGTVTVDSRIGFRGESVNTIITGTNATAASPSFCGFRFINPAAVGLAPHIKDIGFFGFTSGPAVAIQTSGAIVSDCFFSSNMAAIDLEGQGSNYTSDTLISNIIFDQNAYDVRLYKTQNTTIDGCISYLAGESIQFNATGGGNTDVTISNTQFNYCQVSGISVNSNPNKNIKIRGCDFMLNGQPSGFQSFIFTSDATGDSEVLVDSCNFRNWKNKAIRFYGAVGVYTAKNCTFNAKKTLAEYSQSADSVGIEAIGGARVNVIGGEFKNIGTACLAAYSASKFILSGPIIDNTCPLYTRDAVTSLINGTLYDSNGLLRFIAQAVAPTATIAGQSYFDETVARLKTWDGGAWYTP